MTLGNKVKGEVEDKRKAAWNSLDQMGRKVERDITGAAKTVEREVLSKVEAEGKRIVGEIETTFEQRIPDLITKQAPRIIEHVAADGIDFAGEIAEQMQMAVASPGLRLSKQVLQATYDGLVDLRKSEPELVAFIDVQGAGTKVGPVKLRWSALYTRAETILGVFDRWIEKPPKASRRDIRDFLVSLGPDIVTFDVDVKANIVVVGSTVMEAGVEVPEIPFPLAVALLDRMLKAAGVPE